VRAVNRQAHKSEKGSSLVEGALVFFTVVSMIFFVFDLGRLLMTEQFISERARVTARMAAVNSWDSTTVANYLCYNSTSAPANVNGASAPGYLGLVPSNVSYSTLGTSGSADYRLKVTVSGVQMFTWIPYIAGAFTAAPITATAPGQSLGATN
jgi:hypothetical protein